MSRKVADAPATPTAAEKQSAYAQQLVDVPEFASYGAVLNSSNPAQLTENETEYQVNCVKHIFTEHVVFQVCLLYMIGCLANGLQFNISNTLPDTILEQVSVIMVPQSEDNGLTEDFIIPLSSLSNSPGIVYVSFTREQPDVYTIASFQCSLKYVSKEVDPSTGVPEEEGYEDDYQIEEVELSAGGDYIVPSYTSFGSEWDRLQSAPSATETFSLSAMESLKGTSQSDGFTSVCADFSKAACDSIIEVLNMEALGGSENPSSASVHTLQLSGLVTGGGGKVLARCRMTFSRGQGVTLELSVRAEKQGVCDLVLLAVGG